jgi:hypothetical protein
MQAFAIFMFLLSIGQGAVVQASGLLPQGESPGKAAEGPIWARGATVLDLSCTSRHLPIAAPDHQSSILVLCKKRKDEDPTYSLRVTTSAEHKYEVPLDEGAHELLWAPNSKAFFVDGGTSGYAGFFVSVYRIDASSGVQKEDLTKAAQTDMVASFPPCKAANRSEALCAKTAEHPDYNMSAVAWTRDSSAIDVFAEVPCSSSYGGIMCQVIGYELSVPDGHILARLAAKEIQEHWTPFMAWKMHMPDPPVYGPPQQTF